MVLFQITCYIYLRLKPLKSKKKEFNMPQITGTYISLFCPLKIKITPFADGFRTSYSLKVNYKLKVYKLKFHF